jgi:hypothetical protein
MKIVIPSELMNSGSNIQKEFVKHVTMLLIGMDREYYAYVHPSPYNIKRAVEHAITIGWRIGNFSETHNLNYAKFVAQEAIRIYKLPNEPEQAPA